VVPVESTAAVEASATGGSAPSGAAGEHEANVEATPAAAESTAPGSTSAAAALVNGVAFEGFGNAYNFGGKGRVLGIKGGSLAPTGHGYQMSWHKTGLLFSGNTWLDTGYRKSTNQILNDEEKFVQEGRVLLRVTPTYSYGNWFVKAQAELLAHSKFAVQNSYIDTDDAWLALGYWDVFDIQVGRYEAWEVYHKGLGLERDTLEDLGAQGGEDIYEVNNVFYRESSFGQVAAHVYPLDWLRVEVNSVLGYQGGDGAVGVRPAVIADFGFLKIKAAAERKVQKPTQKDPLNKRKAELYGFGGSIQGIIEPYVELGVNGGLGYADRWKEDGQLDPVGTTDTLSYGGFVNFNLGSLAPVLDGLILGGGANLTTRNNVSCFADNTPQVDANGDPVGALQPNGTIIPLFLEGCGRNRHNQFYGAIQYGLFDHAIIKAVFGLADADQKRGPDEAFVNQHNSMWNARIRFLVWY